MRYLYLIALAISMAMPTVSTLATEPTADQRLAEPGSSDSNSGTPDSDESNPRAPGNDDAQAVARPQQPPRQRTHRKCPGKPSGVFSETGLVRFRLQSGRIDIDPMRYRKGSQDHLKDGFTETITVSSSSGIPSVYYRYRDDYQRIQLVAEHGKSLRLESTIHATGEQAVLEQRVDGQIHWQTRRDPIVTSDLDLQVQGPTLMHIVGQDEAGFQVHFEPIVTRMLRGRSVIDLTRRTEEFMRNNSADLMVVSAERVQDLVQQLRSPKSSRRRSASSELRRYGTSVVPHLAMALRRDDLDAEQVSRIRALIRRCPRIDEDTPSSLACLLSTDRDHWKILAKKMDQTQFIAANAHIRRCGLEGMQR